MGFHPQEGEMVVNGKQEQITVNTTDAPLSQTQGTYFHAVFTNQTILSCELHNSSANSNHDFCADLRPENSLLNFQLLLLNGVRLVFTKAVAFSTVLTFRAMIA